MRLDYAVTFVVTVLLTISYLLTLRVVARDLGADAFGEYALARRTLSVAAPLAILGADYATARFVAYAIGHGRPSKPYLPAALAVMVGSASAVSLMLVVLRGAFARLFYGSEGFVSLVLVLPPLLLGVGLHSVGYNYLRGRSEFHKANGLLLVNYVVVPLAAVYLGGSVVRALLVMAVLWIAVSLAFIVRMPMSVTNFRTHLREVLRYGTPRAPGDIIQLALFAAPGIFAAHLANLRVAGLIALGTAALSMVGAAASPIAFILLPLSARMLGAGEVDALRRHVWRVLGTVLVLGTAGTGAVELSVGPLIRAYLGPGYEGANYVMRIMLLAVLPYAIYFTLKSVVDARHVRAINTRNMVVAAASFAATLCVLALFTISMVGVLTAFVLSMFVLGTLTAWEAAKVLREPPTTKRRVPAEATHRASG